MGGTKLCKVVYELGARLISGESRGEVEEEEMGLESTRRFLNHNSSRLDLDCLLSIKAVGTSFTFLTSPRGVLASVGT